VHDSAASRLGAPFRAAARDVLGSRGVPPEQTTLFALEPSGAGALREAAARSTTAAVPFLNPTRDAEIPVDIDDGDIDDGEIGDDDTTAAVHVARALSESGTVARPALPPPLPRREGIVPRSSYTAFYPKAVRRLDSVERAG
jgi:hypothetical protein